MFETYTKVIQAKKEQFYAYQNIEKLRKKLLYNHDIIEISDFGAGSKKDFSKNSPSNSSEKIEKNTKKISQIAKISAKKPELAQLLFRLVNWFQPNIIFDLGTSLGLTTSYLAAANPKASVYTFEADKNLLTIAKENFKILQLSNVEVVEGNLNETLAAKTSTVSKIDFTFLDANHRYLPTISYFETLLPHLHEGSIVVLDDIYWSEEMKKAWQNICQRPEVMLSIDLFWVGILFFRKKQPKQHFLLRF
jgi:predicted O-methyltransferase YrrM